MDRLVNDDVRCRTARHWRRTANSWEAASKAFDFFFRSSSIHPELVAVLEYSALPLPQAEPKKRKSDCCF
jgi:hypothetical protein